MKKCVRDIIQKYFVVCYIIGILLILLWLIVSFIIQNYIGTIVVLLIILLSIKVVIRIIANKTLLSVLFKELDAEGFQEIINDSRLKSPLIDRINAAMSSGDYQTAINIATKQLINKKSHIRMKNYYLAALARAYFELRDFDKLHVILAKYEEYKVHYPTKSFLRLSNSIWNYYSCFLEQNYEACKSVCKERNLALRPKAWDTKLRKLQNDFLYAIACYENREFDEATDIFEKIMSFAPQMNYAKLSQKYLSAIEKEQDVSLFDAELLPDAKFKIYDKKVQTRFRNYRIIKRVCFAVVAVLIILSLIFNILERDKNSDSEIFNNKLNSAIMHYYNDAEVLDYFNLYKDEKYVDSLGLVVENNSVHLVEIISFDNGQTIDVSLIEENIKFDKYYCVKSPVSNYYIGFVLSQSELAEAETYYVREQTIKQNCYWLIIDYIDKTYKSEKQKGTVELTVY